MLNPLAPPTIMRVQTHNKTIASEARGFPRRLLAAHDIEIAISHCGVCRSHHVQDNGPYMSFAVVPDLGIVGTVVATGKHVAQHRVGDRVGVGAVLSPCQDKLSCLACMNDEEAKCPRLITTYGDSGSSGPRPFGGYERVAHVDARHAIKIPDALPSEAAAPLFSAGAAAHKMLKESVKPGHVVGVVGVGALGHLALQFILALGATPIAFSTSPEKEASARWLGAEDFINTSCQTDVKRAASTVDVLLMTSPAPDQPCHIYAEWIKPGGKMIMIGEPEGELESAMGIITAKGLTVVFGEPGSIDDTTSMLELAAETGVRPVVESYHVDDANEAFDQLDQGKARYMVVLRTC